MRTATEVVISAASAWEVATKYRLGKLPPAEELVGSFLGYLEEPGTVQLPVSTTHALPAGRIPGDHRDPFDRLLAARAIIKQLSLISADTSFGAFPIRVVW